MSQSAKLWYHEISAAYHQTLVRLIKAVRLDGQWRGDENYDRAVSDRKELLASVGKTGITCGDLRLFESWVSKEHNWVTDPCKSFTGTVPAELADSILQKQNRRDLAYQQACEEFDPSLWLSLPFTRWMNAQQSI